MQKGMEMKRDDKKTERMRMEIESRSENEEFARVAAAVFLSRLDPTVEEMDDIKTAVSEAVTIYIEIQICGREARITIRDEGIGIADIEKAMEPMYTSDPSGERSGMGFSFMEAFMDQVSVESEPGLGTAVIMKKTVGR